MAQCSVADCTTTVRCRGLCEKHYRQRRRAGPLPPLTTEQRFWEKLAPVSIRPELITPCWLWTGAQNNKGYGQLGVDRRHVLAHRFSFMQAWGLPESWLSGVQIDHLCHVNACVNPLHLRPASCKQNHENLRGANRNSASGVRGVSWFKTRACWVAKVKHNGRQVHVGYFDDLAEAEAAVIAKRNELFTHNDLDRRAAA